MTRDAVALGAVVALTTWVGAAALGVGGLQRNVFALGAGYWIAAVYK